MTDTRAPAPVVHFGIVGRDLDRLREFSRELSGCESGGASPAALEVSEPGRYGFLDPPEGAAPVPGGIGGGLGSGDGRAIFGVDDVTRALADAERLGGSRAPGPAVDLNGMVAVGHLRDREGRLVGVVGPR